MAAAPSSSLSSSSSSTDPFASLSSTPPFRLDLFAVLDKVQASHGIPHQDYAQYHTYCTHRLSRLRHLRAVQTDLVHSHHYAAQAHAQSVAANAVAAESAAAAATTTTSSSRRGPRHAYCPRNVVPLHRGLHHEALLWNIVFQAERAWAQACAAQQQQQQQQQQNSTSGTNKRSRHSFILKRLHKAQKWATTLVQVLEEQPQQEQHAETLQECRSYAAWMTANAALEQEDYTTAFHRYKESMDLLSSLVVVAAAATTTGSSAASETVSEATLAVWKTRSETILRPLVRFCAYHAKEDASLLSAEAAPPVERSTMSASPSETSPKKDSHSASSIVLRFRGKQVRLDSYKQLAVLYLKMEGLLKTNQPSELNETQFLQISTDLDDALRLVQAELMPPSTKNNTSSSNVNQNKRRDLLTLAAYLESQKLRLWRIQQERHVLPELTSDAEIVHVYDQLLQNAMALANLTQPHVATQEAGGGGDDEALGNTTTDNEDDPYWLTAQAHVVRIRAVRCFYLARLYETELQASPATVLALLRHAAKLNKRAQEEIAACIEDDDDDTDDEKENPMERREDYEFYLKNLETVADQIPTMMARVQAARFVQQHQGSSRMAVKTNRPLWLRLDEMDAGGGTALVDRPPQPIAIPCKPVFYDVAWQHVVGDATALEKIQAYIEAHEPKSKTSSGVGGGLLSWFSR